VCSYPRLSREKRTNGTSYFRFCAGAGFFPALTEEDDFAVRPERFVAVGAAALRLDVSAVLAGRWAGRCAAGVCGLGGGGAAASRLRWTLVNRTSSPKV
jgi:hypothetical protein